MTRPRRAVPAGAAAHRGGPSRRWSCRGGRSELVARAGQLALGLVPGAARDAHRRILRAAHREQRLQSPLAAVLLDAVAPLHGAAMIAHAIARANQVAAGEPNEQTIAQLVRRGSRRSLRRAHADPPSRVRSSPAQSHRAPGRPSRSRSRRAPGRCGSASAASASASSGSPSSSSANTAATRREPRMLRRVRLPFEQSARALQPAFGDTAFATNAALSQAIQTAMRRRQQVAAIAIRE